MKKYKVKCEPDWEYIYITVEANNEEDAKEKAEEVYSNGDADDEIIEQCNEDLSGSDYCTAIEAEEIK